MNKSDLAVNGQAAALVSNEQKTRLILAAKKAFDVQTRSGLTEGVDFNTWRKSALWDACQKGSFRMLDQREYGRAMAYFIDLAGGKLPRRWVAVAKRESGPEGDRRRAEWMYRKTCRDVADVFGGVDGAERYARALLLKIHKCDPATATATQLWQVVFTLRNRAKQGRK